MTAHGYQRPKGKPAPTGQVRLISIFESGIGAVGPFVSVVAGLVLVMTWAPQISAEEGIAETFVSAATYATVFGGAISAPWSMVVTRHLGDRVYQGDWRSVPDTLFPTMTVVGVLSAVIAFLFLRTVDLGVAGKTGVFCLAVSTAMSSITTGFVGTVRPAMTVAKIYGACALVSTVLATALALKFGSEGLLFGYASGQVMAMWLLVSVVLNAAGFPASWDWRGVSTARAHADLWVTGLLLGVGFYVDQVVFAFSDLGADFRGFITAPVYASYMVVSMFTAVPAIALALATVDRRVAPSMTEFTRVLYSHYRLRDIEAAAHAAARQAAQGLRNVIYFQFTVLSVVWFVAEDILVAVKLEPSGCTTLRMGAVGATFMVIMIYCNLVLFHLDRRREVLIAACVLFATNVLISGLSLLLGPHTYGVGYALGNIFGATTSARFMGRKAATQTRDTFVMSSSEQERFRTAADFARRNGGYGIYRPV